VVALTIREQVEALVLSLDVGTSSVRASIVDSRGHIDPALSTQIPYNVQTTADGGVEMDVAELEAYVYRAVDDVLERIGPAGTAIAAVAISTIWHSVLGVDRTGRAVTPLFTWADTRSARAADELQALLDERLVHARTGCMLHTSYFPAKLRWLHQTRPTFWRDVWRWISFGEYLHLQCFGDSACSVSMASGTGLLNQHTTQWDQELLQVLALSSDHLSPLVARGYAMRGLRESYASRWPILSHIPWYPAVGDGAASNVGAGCISGERIAAMVGTSAAMRVVWTADDVVIPAGLWCYRIDERRFVLGGALSNGGNLMSWMTETLRLRTMAETESAIALAAPDGHHLTILPFLAGERSPGWKADARAAIVGLSLHHTPADILQASMEAVAYRLGLIYGLLRPVAPDAAEIIASGGALLNSPIWVQMVSDVLGQPVTVSEESEASSRGAALLAFEALGVIPDLSAAPARTGHTYLPRPHNHDVYMAAGQRQRALYDALIVRPWQQHGGVY
jgi:gluconokinase